MAGRGGRDGQANERRAFGALEAEVLSALWAAPRPLVPADVQAAVAVALLSRLAAGRFWPPAAAWAMALAAAALGASTAGALVLLACPLPARVPVVAALGRWRPHAVAAHAPTPVAVSVIALG